MEYQKVERKPQLTKKEESGTWVGRECTLKCEEYLPSKIYIAATWLEPFVRYGTTVQSVQISWSGVTAGLSTEYQKQIFTYNGVPWQT